MNQKTSTLLTKVANIYGKKLSSLKKTYISLSNEQKKLLRQSFIEVVSKYNEDIKTINQKKLEEQEKVIKKLESKLKTNG